MNITVVEPYNRLYESDKNYIVLRSGRNAGKSYVSAEYILIQLLTKSRRDCIVVRDSYADLKTSVFMEIENRIVEEGLTKIFKIKKNPLLIENKINGSYCYFLGAGGSDLSRTRGFKPKNPLSTVFFEETQQFSSKGNLDQALATFRRYFDNKIAKVIYAFNPESSNSHWLNMVYREWKIHPDYECIESSYKNIARFLNHIDIRAIEMERKLNPQNYRYVYLGTTEGIFGSVYYSFKADRHHIDEKQFNRLKKKYGIRSILYAIDGATTRDATAGSAIAMLGNGQSFALQPFYYDPSVKGAISNEQYVPLFKKWFKEIEEYHNVGYTIPKYIVVDAGSPDLVVTMNYHYGNKGYFVYKWSNKDIIKMTSVVNNCFSKNKTFVVNFGGYRDYSTNVWQRNHYPHVTQLESVTWDEKGKGYNEEDPNDCTDTFNYGLSFYYNNPENINFGYISEYYEMGEIVSG